MSTESNATRTGDTVMMRWTLAAAAVANLLIGNPICFVLCTAAWFGFTLAKAHDEGGDE